MSDPLNEEEVCYESGWAHNDPGDLVSQGAEQNDVLADVQLIDQCGERVDLWDFYGEYIFYILRPRGEAAVPARPVASRRDFIEETGEFSFLLAVYEGVSGNPATLDDSVEYAEANRESRVSVFADDGCTWVRHDAAGAPGVVD